MLGIVIFFYDSETALAMKKIFMDDVAQSVPMKDLRTYNRPRFMARLTESLLRMLAPLM